MAIPLSEFGERRQRLSAQLPAGSVVLLPAATTVYRNRDAEYPFRQHSDFLYLTGYPEPDAWLVLHKAADGKATESLLFVLPRDREKEVWTGYRIGPEGAVERYGMDRSLALDAMDDELPAILARSERIYYPFADQAAQARIHSWCVKAAATSREHARSPQTLCNLEPLVHEMRLIKSAAEQQLMREAGSISADGHVRAMRRSAPGVMEYQLEAEILNQFAQRGCRSPAYATIVGSGANGCILHYTENSTPLRDGDLVLIDAGCERDGYAGDITRTFPVNGRFSAEQRDLYQLVLDAQYAAIAAVKPGSHFNYPHECAVEVLTAGLVRLGLLAGEVEDLIKDEAYRPFYMHRTSHWLGLDVHDVGDYKRDGEWRMLEVGMVLTIEPGLYVAPDNETVEERWRGIGIRIEDDVLVTKLGAEVLTAAVPKTIAEIEQLMAANNNE